MSHWPPRNLRETYEEMLTQPHKYSPNDIREAAALVDMIPTQVRLGEIIEIEGLTFMVESMKREFGRPPEVRLISMGREDIHG